MLTAVTEAGRVEAVDFDDFYARDYGRIVALAFALTGDRGAAEDAAQDAFLAAHRDWDRIGGYDRPGAWVRRVVLNRAKTRSVRRGRESRALARFAAAEPATVEDRVDDTHAFWPAVRTLPAQQRQCVILHYVDDLDAAEIGTVLELAASTVRVHLHRARARLAELLALEEGDA
jgi:RNA polymerase sigma-70 factor (ECF subfamily)